MGGTEFLLACREVMESGQRRQGIGTLGEKTLHAVLKRYFDPRPEHHEVRTGPYVADIRGESGIVEIQTRSFDRLREKLDYFLGLGPVAVIYPISALKWVIWLDGDGNASPRRKSPKRPTACEILPELYRLGPLLRRQGLSFCAVLLEAEEYRLKDDWSADGKKGSTRFERLPVALLDQVWLRGPEDYKKLIPPSLPDEFTAKEFGRAAGLSPKKSSVAAKVLYDLGAVERTGRVRGAYLYRRRPDSDRLADGVAGV